MKRTKLIMGILSFLLISFLSVQVNADDYVIDDERLGATSYWGTTQGGWTDRIGHDFEITGMEVTQSGSQLTVRITAPDNGYFEKYIDQVNLPGLFPPGDLFIDSQGWTVSGIDAHHVTDTFSVVEGWDYFVSFEDQNLYALTGYVATSASSPYIWRPDQAWRGIHDGSDNGVAATVNLDDTSLTFIFDTSGLNLQNNFGLHWTMMCGNDVVEGGVPSVPEPATLLLLGVGLAGLGLSSRKLKK